jgi:type II secretory pathway component PulL
MSEAIYVLYNYFSDEKLYFLINNNETIELKDDELEKFSNVKKNIFLISDLFDSLEVDLPETNSTNQKKAIPFLIQDSLLDDVNNYSWLLNADDEILLLTNKEKLNNLINKIDLYSTSSLSPIEASFDKDNLIIIDDKVILSLQNQWYWSGSLEVFCNQLPFLEEKLKDKMIESHCLGKIPEELIDKNFLKFSLYESIQSLWAANLPSLNQGFNILKGEFEPKINWVQKIKDLKFYIYSVVAIYSIFLVSNLIQISSLSILNYQLNNQLSEVFKSKFPNETIENDLISQVNNLVNLDSYSKKNLDSLRLLSNEIALMENLSLISINSDSNKITIEVEAVDYDQLEELVKLMSTMNIDLSIGSSRRLNNLLVGELNVRTF